MRNKLLILVLIIFSLPMKVLCATSANQLVSATLSRGGGGGGGGGGDTPTGGIIAGGVVGGSAATGASALAFAPLLLAGLEPNPVVCAAAPIDCVCEINCYLQEAIKYHGGIKIENNKLIKVKDKYYFAQNDCAIFNGTYDVDEIKLPEELKTANRVRVNITIASQPYKEVKGDPELAIGIYKDINRPNLNKKFETQQFLRHYMMAKYEIPLKTAFEGYGKGIQKLTGIINVDKIEYKDSPLMVVIRYTEGGFRRNLTKNNPIALTYAYIVEFEKIR